MATDNPGVGKIISKFQALYRGYIYRKINKIVKKGSSEDKKEEDNDDDEEEGEKE